LIRGSYDLDSLMISAVPLVVSPLEHPTPTEIVVGIVTPGKAAPIARAGDVVVVSYQLLAWDTGEVADATPAGEPVQSVLGSTELPTAISDALIGSTAGSQRIALFPAGTPGMPTYIPDDIAYLLVATVSAVVPG
jgi:hypothetical protein